MFAQPPSGPRPTTPLVIQVGVDLIQIDASVTDAQGLPVTDLRMEDFSLEVDGEKRAISNAAFFQRRPRLVAARNAETPSADPSGARQTSGVLEGPSTVVFLVDDLNMSASSLAATKESLAGFVKDWGEFNTRAALRTTSDQSLTFSLYISPERFAGAIGTLRYNVRSTQGGTSTRTVQNDANVTSRLSMEEEEDLVTRSPRSLEQFQQRISNLAATINTLRAVPGRKAVVFISEGLTLGMRRQDRLNLDAPLLSFFGDTDVETALRSVAEVANRASVVLYTVDPRGLAAHDPGFSDGANTEQVSSVTAARRTAHLENQRTLQQLADETGGLSTVNTNGLGKGLAGVLRDQGSYYLIGFEPSAKAFKKASGKPKFHRIRLSVNRENVTVRTRAGFYGVTDAEMSRRTP